MTVTVIRGSIFDSTCECIVNPTNSIGVMGAGLAKTFMERYPDTCNVYNEISRRLVLEQGEALMEPWIDIDKVENRHIMMFATKINWRFPSKMEYIIENFPKALELLREKQITSVAFPLLGAGLGGLDKSEVLLTMTKFLEGFEGRSEIWIK